MTLYIPLVIVSLHRANAVDFLPETFIQPPTHTKGGKEYQKEGAKDLARDLKEKEVARALPNAWSHGSHNNHPFPPTGILTDVYACSLPPSAQSPIAHTITGCQPTTPLLIALIFGSRFTAPTFSNTRGALCIMAEKALNVADIDSKHCSSKQHTHTTINNQQQHTRNQQRKRKSIVSTGAQYYGYDGGHRGPIYFAISSGAP